MNEEESKKSIDWLVSHGMTFHKAICLINYCEQTGKTIPSAYVSTLDYKEDECTATRQTTD